MTPLQFEQRYAADWHRLGELVAHFRQRRPRGGRADALEFTVLYRRCCEQLALAQGRDYPEHLTAPLESLTADAHQLIYRRSDWGLARLAELFRRGFPLAVRRQRRQIWLAAALLMVPTLVMAVLVYRRPELIDTIVDPQTAGALEQMYSKSGDSIGRLRTAETDWQMFAFYIRHNISLSFQCFAGGVLFGVGSVFFLLYNGLYGGAVAGYLLSRGLSQTFFPFVVTHSAFELTAIVLAGGAGLRIGQSLLSPGQHSRTQALIAAGREAIVVMYGVIVMLLIAASIEAFWSSAMWMPAPMKYGIALLCWIAVLSYLCRPVRHAD